MAKDEKILKKIDKLLKMYGVEDEKQRENFLADVQDAKYDEEELVEENKEETEETDEKVETEEETTEENLSNDNEETEEKEEVVDEKQEEAETPNEDEVAEEGEEVDEEEAETEEQKETEEVEQEEKHEADAVETLKGRIDEMQKANDGLVARLENLENILSQLGVPANGQFGSSPHSQKEYEDNSDMAEIIRKRMGY